MMVQDNPGHATLVIHDDDVIRAELCDALRPSSPNLHECSTPKEGYAIIRKRPIQQVFIQSDSHELNAIEFIALLKAAKNTCDIQVVIITANRTNEYRRAGLEEGAKAFLYCPFTQSEAQALAGLSPDTAPQRMGRVMVVEDSLIVCRVYEKILDTHGYHAQMVTDSRKAVDAIQQFKPDLILLDANMPYLDGYDLTRLIKSDPELSSIRIIMVTGDIKKESSVNALERGVSDFLTKPFDEEVLVARMQTQITNKWMFDDLQKAYHEMKVLKDRLELLSITDGLTGLYNHRHYYDSLDIKMRSARQTGKPMSVTILDIDHFKKFNDTYGHKAGDLVLVSVGVVLESSCRDTDMVARYGGEEFATIMVDTSLEEAQEQAEVVRAAIEETRVPWEGEELKVTVSIGVAQWSGEENENGLITRADMAMYKSKKGGRNRVTRAND